MRARVVDASAVVSALLDDGPSGRWAADLMAEGRLVAPHSMPAEVGNVLRRAVLTNRLSPGLARLAHQDMLNLAVELYPYAPFAGRIWAMSSNITPYDAWYVAVAEFLEAELVTLDRRLTRAPGISCSVLTPLI